MDQSRLYGGHAQLSLTTGDTEGQFLGIIGNQTAEIKTDMFVKIKDSEVKMNENIIELNGDIKGSDIYGGYLDLSANTGGYTPKTQNNKLVFDASIDLSGLSVMMNDNTIRIGDNAVITDGKTSLYGGAFNETLNVTVQPGEIKYTPPGSPLITPTVILEKQGIMNFDLFTGNTLVVEAMAPLKLDQIANFENYSFTLNPDAMKPVADLKESDAMVAANTIIFGSNADNKSDHSGEDSKVKVAGIHSGRILNVGDGAILLYSANMSGAVIAQQAIGTVTKLQQGISLLYDVKTTVDMANNRVVAEILKCEKDGVNCDGSPTIPVDPDDPNPSRPTPEPGAKVNPQLKALAEGRLSGALQITRGADLIAYDTFAEIDTQEAVDGLIPFWQMSGSHVRYKSGSHITSDDYIALVGLSLRQNNVILGAFIEAGWGKYDNYNSFSNMDDVHGDGHNRYYGLGMLGRYQFDSGLYTDASIRFGKTRNRFDTDDLVNFATGEAAKYSIKNNYMSAHLGLGYIHKINELLSADVSLKYLWTEVDGKNLNIAGDDIRFHKIKSNRLRLDTRLNYVPNDQMTIYAGLGYEHEFDGKAQAVTYGMFEIDAPSVRGGTGTLSLGMKVQPEANSALSFDVGAQGYVGQRRGGGLSLKVRYVF